MDMYKIRNSITSNWDGFIRQDIQELGNQKAYHFLKWGSQISYEDGNDNIYLHTHWNFRTHWLDNMIDVSENQFRDFLNRGVVYLRKIYGSKYHIKIDCDSDLGYQDVWISVQEKDSVLG